jgi:CTP:molybdopterin cytidylyltransferase MocA/uncharacterized protein YdeI (YjbR/CyaY-like superfamily)
VAERRPGSAALAAVVLAAGQGTRFGGPKLVESVRGRPIIAGVVDVLRTARPTGAPLYQITVVTGYHADVVARVLGATRTSAFDFAGDIQIVRNPEPGRGMSSSIAVGIRSLGPDVEACFIILGDQPNLRTATLEVLAERRAVSGAAIVVPRYTDGGGSNPVLLDRRAWSLAAGLQGDTGLRAVIAAHPELVEVVEVPGANPDVDTADDLAALAPDPDPTRTGDATAGAAHPGLAATTGSAATAVTAGPSHRRASALDSAPHVQADDRATWRAWLEANHASESGAWLVTWKPSSGMPGLDYEAAVEEALCFGWIDSTSGRVDERRSKLYFARRKPRSVWAASNKSRVERLIAAGRMAPAGLAAIERAKANGSWDRYGSAERLEVPPDLQAALNADPVAAGRWAAYPASLQKQLLGWIAIARRPETRAARVAETARLASRNERPRGWRGAV